MEKTEAVSNPPLLAVSLKTPLGPMRAECSAAGIYSLSFPAMADRPAGIEFGESAGARWLVSERPAGRPARRQVQHLDRLIAWLLAYFGGVPPVQAPELDFTGLSDFHARTARRLMKIPCGATVTYGDLARDLGMNGGARAVGGVMKRNRHVLVVPCHRVLATPRHEGELALGGFSGGLALKKILLDFEEQTFRRFETGADTTR